MDATNGRQRRGLEIAARCRVIRRGLGWSVPSQSGAGEYTVTGFPFTMTGDGPRCTCPDYETLAKVLCHNLVVLIHEMCELGIDPVFWAGPADAQEVLA